jgi:hypothetical protein
MTIDTGTVLSSYEILSVLGKGGMGEVWRARDTKLGREVAIKTLPAGFAADQDRLSRFEREARVLAGNIVGALAGRPPQPFVYQTLGLMGSLGHFKGFGQLLNVRVRGFPAWLIRRTYYLLQMPGWGRRLRIMIDGPSVVPAGRRQGRPETARRLSPGRR